MKTKSLLTGLLTLGLACGSIVGPRATHAASTVTLTWLTRTDPVVNPWEDATIKSFEALHPTIQIQQVKVPTASYDQKMLTMIAGGSPPDVFSHWGSNSWADLVYRGVAADLTPYINASHFSFEGMPASLRNLYTIKGHVYGIPFASGGSFLFYNVDLLKKARLATPPTDWNDKSWNWATVLRYAQAMNKARGSLSNRVFGLYDNLWPPNANAMLWGGDIFPQSAYATGVVDRVQATSAPVRQATQWQADQIFKYKIGPTPSQATSLSTAADPFLSGRIGLEMTGVWGFWVFQPATFKWAAAPLPYIKTDKDVVFTDPWIMAKKSAHPQEAWTFLEYLSDPRYGGKTYMAATGVVPPFSQLLPGWAAGVHTHVPSLSVAQLTQLANGSMAHGQESINHLAINYGQYDSVIANVLTPVWTGRETSSAALAQLQQQLTSTIQRAGISGGR